MLVHSISSHGARDGDLHRAFWSSSWCAWQLQVCYGLTCMLWPSCYKPADAELTRNTVCVASNLHYASCQRTCCTKSIGVYLPAPFVCALVCPDILALSLRLQHNKRIKNFLHAEAGYAAQQSCTELAYQSFLPMAGISVPTSKMFVNRAVTSSCSTAHC